MNEIVRRIGVKVKTALLRRRVRYLTRDAWDRWHKKVFGLHPEYRKPAPREIEREHLRLWRRLRRDVSLDTIRACYGMSGKAAPEIVPEEVYESEIERSLNRSDFAVLWCHKSFYDKWFGKGLFPEIHFQDIDGRLFTGDFEHLDAAGAARLVDSIEYPCVLKPSMGMAGRDVHFPADRQELRELLATRKNYLVQRRIRPHPWFARYYDRCLNTLRVCVYRSVVDNSMHVLNAAMRMGKGGSLDNLTAGGIVRFIHPDGRLNRFALDNWGERFDTHPDTGMDFSKEELVPEFDALKALALRLADQLYLLRLTSYDFAMDETGTWRPIELNLRLQTIQMAQYAGSPFFGRFTQEVVDHVKRNPRWR